jgi:hypothetical protein
LLTKEGAKRDHILTALDRLAQSTTPDATVIVYFSGHGYQVSSSMGTAYYLMAFGYDQNQLYSTAISGTEFATKLQAIPAKKLLVLLDCCHAGGLDDTQKIGLTAEKAPLPPEAQALLAEGKGRVFIASSKADEKSLAGKPYSAFTLALIESLAGKGASQQDGYVRVADVALYAREVVPKWTGNRQHPILNFEQADNFVLAYYAGGEMEPKGLPFAGEPEIESEAGEFDRQIINRTEVVASGKGAIAIGGNANNANIITGNNNIVGSGNTVKRVEQEGKYNINLGSVQHLTIGDTFNRNKETEGSGYSSSTTGKGNINDRQRRRLEQELEGLEQQYDLSSEKLSRLSAARTIETDAATIFKQDKQIEQAKAEVDRLKLDIKSIEKQLERE